VTRNCFEDHFLGFPEERIFQVPIDTTGAEILDVSPMVAGIPGFNFSESEFADIFSLVFTDSTGPFGAITVVPISALQIFHIVSVVDGPARRPMNIET
jgi:hypothetical protein